MDSASGCRRPLFRRQGSCAALDDCGFDARPLKLILQSDEENSSRFSSKTTIEYMCEAAKDAADFTAYGIPCLDSLGICGGGIHDRSEWCHLSSLAEIAKRLAASAMYI